MALVKKLQVGGQIDNDLNNELNTQLESFNLKGKDERKVRDALVKFRDYFKDSNGKSFSVDPLSQKYTVSGAGSEPFTGSPDEIHRGWFTGNLKIQNEQDAMSVAAAIYNKAKGNISAKSVTNPNAGSSTGTREAINIGDLGEFVISDIYGTKDNFKTQFGTIKNDEDRKTKIYDFAQQNIVNYLKAAELGKDKFDYSDTEKIKDIQTAINNKDWNAFLNATNKVKWEPSKFLLSEEQKQQLENDTKTAAANKAKESFDKLGLTPELQQKLYNTGFTEVASQDWTPDANAKWFNDILRKNGANVLYNPTTKKHVAVTRDNYFNYGVADQFHAGYGYSWKNDDTGFHWYNPQQHASNADVWGVDKYAGQNIGRELITNLTNAKVYGWSAQDETENYAKNILGHRDFTKQLQVEQNGRKFNLTKDSDGSYRDQQGRVVNLKISGFGGTKKEKINYGNLFPDIAEPTEGDGYEYTQALPEIEKLVQDRQVNSSAARSATALKWALYHDPRVRDNVDEKRRVLDALAQYSELLKQQPLSNKKGGILKAQSGAAFENYRKKYQNQSQQEKTITADKPVKDISGTWKGQSGFENTMDVLSTAGAVGSFVPGYGAIGATVSFGADLVKDLQDGKVDDWGNHALNAGFIGLSAIGLGGLKTLLKVGKMADKGLDVVKLAEKASKLTLKAEESKALSHILKFAGEGKTTAKTTVELLEKAKGMKFTDKQKALFEKGIDTLNMLEKSSVPVLGSNTLGNVIKSSKKVLPALEKLAGNKHVLNTARVATMVPGVTSAIEVAKNTEMLGGEGIEYSKPSDLKNIAITGSVGKTWLKDIKAVKAIKNQVNFAGGEESKNLIHLGDEATPFDISDVEIPKTTKLLLQRGKNAISKKAAETFNTHSVEELTKFRAGVKASLEKQGIDVSKYTKELEQITPKDIRFSKGVKGTEPTIENFAKSTTGNRAKDVKDYEIAKKYLDEFKVKYNIIKPTKVVEAENAKKAEAALKRTAKKLAKQKKLAEARKKSLDEDWQQYEDGVVENKKGGILKGQNGLLLGSLDPKSLAFKANNKANLNWTAAENTSGIFDKDGAYTNEYLNRVKLITPEWFKANQQELQNRITQSGSNYKLTDINQLIRGATDSGKGITWKNKKPGILHDLVFNNETLRNEDPKITNTPLIPPIVPVAVNPRPVVTTNPIIPPVNTTGNIVKDGNKKFDLKKFTKYLPDATDLSNLAMYANTVSTNRNVGNEQRRAITDGMYTLPYRSNQYIRIDSPYSLQGEKQAANIENKASRIANSTSDIDKSMAARFTGAGQASVIRDKANTMDQQRIDQLKGVQIKMNDEVSKDNTKTLGQNRALSSQAFSKIHLINANQDLANSAALNNLVIANARNLPAKQYKKNQTALYNAYTNPEYTNASEAYSKLNTDEGQSVYKKSYDADVKNLKYSKSWEESSHYKSWQDDITKAKNRVDALYKPIQNLMIAQNFQQQLLKSGGSLSKQDKIEIARDKSESTKELKVLEIAFKSIIHNNEMLQKSLIRVFK